MATRTVKSTGGNFSSTGTWVEGAVPTAADSVVFTASSGALTIDSGAVCGTIDFTNYTNTVTFTFNLTVSGSVTLASGFTQAGSSGLNIISSGTLTSNGVTWSRSFTTSPTAGTTIILTLSGNWTQVGNTAFNSGGNATTYTTINSNSFIFGTGSYTVNIIGTTNVNGSATMLVSGSSGTVTFGSSNGVYQLNFTVNTSGSVSFGGTFQYANATFTYTAGTIAAASSLVVSTAGSTTTLNMGSMVWATNIIFGAAENVVLSSNLYWSLTLAINAIVNFSGSGLMTPSGSSASITLGAGVPNGTQYTFPSANFPNPLNIAGMLINGGNTLNNSTTINVSASLTNNTAQMAGTGPINMVGTGTFAISNGNPYWITNPLTINTSGTITIGTIGFASGSSFTYTTGTISLTGTLTIQGSTTMNSGSMIWNNVTFGSGGIAITCTLNSNLLWSGTLTLQNTLGFAGTGLLTPSNNTTTTLYFGTQGSNYNYSSVFPTTLNIKNLTIASATFTVTFNGITTNVNGNLTNSSGIFTGTSTIIMVGTGTISGINSGTAYFQNNLTINTSGTITFPSGNIFAYNTGTFTYTSGTVVTTGSSLYLFLTGTTTTFNTNGITWNNVTISNSTMTFVLNSTFTVGGTVYSQQNGTFTFSGTSGFIFNNFIQQYSSGFGITLKAGNTYQITGGFYYATGYNATHGTVKSDTTSSAAKLIFSPGAVCNISYMDFTDIDASGGRTINIFNGVAPVRCTNVRVYTDLQNIRS